MIYICHDAKIAIYIVSALLALLVLFYILIGMRKSVTYFIYISFLFLVLLGGKNFVLYIAYMILFSIVAGLVTDIIVYFFGLGIS